MNFSVPTEYREASKEELQERIADSRKRLGNRVCILTHHYQRKEIVGCGDFAGDSFDLAKRAVAEEGVEAIIFCGVHFMAESADILSADNQAVYLGNPLAGCPMADMADMADVMEAWELLQPFGGVECFMPISYMNTTASLKAFTGRNGGLICTSSNAVRAFEYAFARRDKIFFFPDENLGQNTALQLGLKPDEIVVWDFARGSGGLTDKQIEKARVIVWKGHCHVHTNFKPEHVVQIRAEYPEAKIVVHPECIPEVVQAADANGSTKFIVEYCDKAPAGSIIAIGTEINLIDRMAHTYPDKKIIELSGQVCPVCANMYRTTLNDLAYMLDNYADVKPIRVDGQTRADALKALERMLEVA